ncbi:C6 transcription factor [Aspergillus ambiguus]|uniref:C6 transcription factor n=1 Tax=Aspergillus ambiguus TaxID=176160 RepID=UPI003CCE0002
MDAPFPQTGDSKAKSRIPSQIHSNDGPQTLSTANPPAMPGSAAHIPQKPNNVAPGTGHQGKKQLLSNAKVAIPRQRSGVAPRYSRRVPLACESCRARKTKCSGDTPICRQCKELRIDCKYPISWRDRTKGELKALSAKTNEYETLLKEIGAFVDGRTSERIKQTLEKFGVNGESSSNNSQPNSVTPQDEDADVDDASYPSSIGSLDAIDRVDEDVNRSASSRATGYMGKNSEVTWLQRLRREAEQRSRKLSGTYEAEPEGDFALHSLNYHLDDIDISVPGPVHAYQMPPRQVADKLFEDYLETIHPFFPIISRTLYRAQYKTFFDSLARPGDKWLAILNMIFAISAKHAHLRQAPWRGEDNDHLVYLTRARILSMNGDVLFSHPDLQQVQVEGLIAFYLLASDQINRSWRITALAVRSAIALGLNMKNTSESTTGMSKEARYRVWWCLYAFEHMLGVMTGRASCISDGICTTPLPLPFDEDKLREPAAAKLLDNQELRQECVDSALACNYVRQVSLNPPGGRDARYTDKTRDTSWLKTVPPSSALVFLYYMDLSVIAQEIVNRVYSLDCMMTPWAHIENRMGELRARLDLWYTNLPDHLNFARTEDQGSDLLRSKLFLAFNYYSARITLGRPCLCRRDAQQQSPNQPSTFSHDMAVSTLESARRLLDLVPDVPDALRLYSICPWWCILHHFMQTATVLLLELSFGSVHAPEEENNILEASKKAIRWLFAMSQCSLASRRAWELCDSNLRRIAVGMNYDMTDMPPAADSGSAKPREPVGAENVDPTPRHTSVTPATVLLNPADPLSLPVVAATQQPQDAGMQYGQSQPFYSGLPATYSNPSPSDLDIAPEVDAYFPYDPISGEFIRSFFPSSTDEDQWEQP